MTKIKKIDFAQFRAWLARKCRGSYRTANLGHRGDGIGAKYNARTGQLKISFGARGGTGILTDSELKVIFDRYVALRARRLRAGAYAFPNFRPGFNMILVPFVPALIRDFECELLLKTSSYI